MEQEPEIWLGWATLGVTSLWFLATLFVIAQNHKLVRATKEANELVVKNFKKQTFESTFFQLLGVHREIVGSMEMYLINSSSASGESYMLPPTPNPDRHLHITGRSCFRFLFYFLRERLSTVGSDPLLDGEQQIRTAYESFYKDHRSSLLHYYKNLYNIISIIDHADDLQNRFYAEMLKGQMTDYEVDLLLFHSLAIGKVKFKTIVEKYGLLENPTDDPIMRMYYLEYFSPEAFGYDPDHIVI